MAADRKTDIFNKTASWNNEEMRSYWCVLATWLRVNFWRRIDYHHFQDLFGVIFREINTKVTMIKQFSWNLAGKFELKVIFVDREDILCEVG